MIVPRTKMGRLSNANEADHGRVVHATENTAAYCHGKALCGTAPGPRSCGWSGEEPRVTCEKCLKKLKGTCHECQIEKGGVVPQNQGAITVSEGYCSKCGGKRILVPSSDYHWPKLGKRAVFD